jgi:hypothetical protein
MRSTERRAAAAALALALALASAPAASARPRSAAGEAGLGIACALSNLIYGPVKLTYAIVGGFIGLVAYGLSAGDEDVAMRVIEPAWRGDYALTPDHLVGDRELEIFGRRGEHRRARAASAGDGGSGGADGDTGWE